MAKPDKKNEDVIDPTTGEVIDPNDPLMDFLQTPSELTANTAGDGGITVKGVVLPANRGITGTFLGYQPFVYLDQRDKKKPVEKVLNWIVLEGLRNVASPGKPPKYEPTGVIVRVMESTRFMQQLTLATPGDRVLLVRNEKITVEGKNDQWNDDVRIYPAEGRKITPITSVAPIRELDTLVAFQKRLAAHTPGATVEKADSDDVG